MKLFGPIVRFNFPLESRSRWRLRTMVGGPFPTRVDFGVDAGTAGRLGLPCGGRLELLVEELTAPEPVEADVSPVGGTRAGVAFEHEF